MKCACVRALQTSLYIYIISLQGAFFSLWFDESGGVSCRVEKIIANYCTLENVYSCGAGRFPHIPV